MINVLYGRFIVSPVFKSFWESIALQQQNNLICSGK